MALRTAPRRPAEGDHREDAFQDCRGSEGLSGEPPRYSLKQLRQTKLKTNGKQLPNSYRRSSCTLCFNPRSEPADGARGSWQRSARARILTGASFLTRQENTTFAPSLGMPLKSKRWFTAAWSICCLSQRRPGKMFTRIFCF